MGMDIHAHLGYGFVIYEQEGDSDPLFDIISELEDVRFSYECNGEEVYYELDRYSLTEELYDQFPGITTIEFGSSDYATIALVANESVRSNGSWSAEPLSLPEVDPRWDSLLKEVCEKVGLEYRKPNWIFGAYYSY